MPAIATASSRSSNNTKTISEVTADTRWNRLATDVAAWRRISQYSKPIEPIDSATMITHVMPPAETNNAFELMKRGESIRGVVTFQGPARL
jgi:Zn-dependent alcohol dehydrogenase